MKKKIFLIYLCVLTAYWMSIYLLFLHDSSPDFFCVCGHSNFFVLWVVWLCEGVYLAHDTFCVYFSLGSNKVIDLMLTCFSGKGPNTIMGQTGPPPMEPGKAYLNPGQDDQMVGLSVHHLSVC